MSHSREFAIFEGCDPFPLWEGTEGEWDLLSEIRRDELCAAFLDSTRRLGWYEKDGDDSQPCEPPYFFRKYIQNYEQIEREAEPDLDGLLDELYVDDVDDD